MRGGPGDHCHGAARGMTETMTTTKKWEGYEGEHMNVVVASVCMVKPCDGQCDGTIMKWTLG